MTNRNRTLYQRDGLSVRLCYYGPGQAMPLHAHGVHQLSWLLAGEFQERHRSSDHDILRPSAGIKPAGLDHANVYGPQGALILSINLSPDCPESDAMGLMVDGAWSPCCDQMAGIHTALSRLVEEQSDLSGDALDDLLALTRPDPVKTQARFAPWLNRVREALRDEVQTPDLEALAQEAGVHRVHLSRRFTKAFGQPPSLYRARCRLARAVTSVVSGQSLAAAAVAAGFADQAHFTHTARRETGLAPSGLRQLLAAG